MAHLTHPTNIGFERFNLGRITNSVKSVSPFTYSEQILVYPGQQWRADVTIPPLRKAEANEWRAFFSKLNGIEGTFGLGDPLSATPEGEGGGTPLVNGSGQTGGSLNIDGASTSQSGWLLAGDYIQLGTGVSARLYMVTDDVDTNSSGEATINIWPNLKSIPDDNDTVIVENTEGAFRLSSGDIYFETSSNSYTRMSFSAVSVN